MYEGFMIEIEMLTIDNQNLQESFQNQLLFDLFGLLSTSQSDGWTEEKQKAYPAENGRTIC